VHRLRDAPRALQQEQRPVGVALGEQAAEQPGAQPAQPALIGGHLPDGHVAAHHVQRGAGGKPAAGDQGAGPFLLEAASRLQRLLQLQAAFEPVALVELHQHREAGADRLAHPAHHRRREAQPVLQAAAVLVAALVGPGREELAEQVAVSGVQLHRVEAGFQGQPGGPGEVGRLILDLGRAHGLAHRAAIDAQFPGGAQRAAADHDRAGKKSAVHELHGSGRPCRVHRLG
jgi:hypothetical protein